jgi:hypothetical protein
MGFVPEPLPYPGAVPAFQPCQIVCLESEQQFLYAEVVQTVEGRQICWVRPLLLTEGVTDRCLRLDPNAAVLPEDNGTGHWLDLRNSSDLLLPAPLFRAAFDTEVLPLLTLLYRTEPHLDADTQARAHAQLSQFVRQIWRSQPDQFQA